MKYQYRYTKNGNPATHCPECGNSFTHTAGIIIVFGSNDGRHQWELPSNIDAGGLLVDSSGSVETGQHSTTLCGMCRGQLIELGFVEENVLEGAPERREFIPSAPGVGGILNDDLIRRCVKIEPFGENCPPGDISYGITSYGYDMRLDNKFKIFTNVQPLTVVDPKNFNSDAFVDYTGPFCLVPPNSFVLGVSVETFEIPREVLAICVGKSTYARCGIVVNVTPLEPEWRGKVTIEISNTTPLPAKIYAGEGIAQVIFIKGVETCKVSYADKKGRYQDQKGLTLPFVRS